MNKKHQDCYYAVKMSVPRGDCPPKMVYVFDAEDIEKGRWEEVWVDELFKTREEAVRVLYELQEYCKVKGYKDVHLFIEETTPDFVTNVTLIKGDNDNRDTLCWSYMGKDYTCTGEFYVDECNILHHNFISPLGKEIDIVIRYN